MKNTWIEAPQESSSEAVNAWAGLVLWGEATGNRRLRDLGIYLLSSEIASVNQYWFDLDRQVLAPEYGKAFAAMVFAGNYAYDTWWTQEPRQIFGINMLPITPASTYLGANPEYVRNLVAGSLASNRTHTILALVHTLTNPVFGQTLHAMEDVVRRHGFHLHGILSSYEKMPKGSRRVVIRTDSEGNFTALRADLEAACQNVRIDQS